MLDEESFPNALISNEATIGSKLEFFTALEIVWVESALEIKVTTRINRRWLGPFSKTRLCSFTSSPP